MSLAAQHKQIDNKQYNSSLVWDAHAGVFPSPDVDLNLLDDWHSNGVSYLSINVGFDVMDWHATLATLAAYRQWVLRNSDRFILAGSVNDITHARESGKLALSFDIEGMNALNGDINMLGVYHALGVRQMLFAYNLNNQAAGGCHDTDMALTPFGREIVQEMNILGIVVDCSHASYTTTMDIMEISKKPVVFTHSNPAAICQHARNINDEQIKACAETGGVIGINGMGIFLGDNIVDNDIFIRHICYISDLVGCRHIGLGLDYSPPVEIDIGTILSARPDYWPPGQGYDTPNIKHACPAQLADLVTKLQNHGFNQTDITGILGENFQRVARATWI